MGYYLIIPLKGSFILILKISWLHNQVVFMTTELATEEHMVALMLSETAIGIENVIRRDLRSFLNTRRPYIKATLNYCQRFGSFKNLASIEKFRKQAVEWSLTHEIVLTNQEICSLGNLLPT